MPTKKELANELKIKIINRILEEIPDIPAFIMLELRQIFKYLNYYKLQKIFLNIDEFIDILKKQKENYEKNLYYKLDKFNFKI